MSRFGFARRSDTNHGASTWWNALIDRWVRVKSRRLDDAALTRRKLVHTAQIVAVVLLSQLLLTCASLALLTRLAFADRLAVAGAWAVFTAGDGLSALVGRLAGGPTLPWNRAKTWSGSAAFLAGAGLALLILLR